MRPSYALLNTYEHENGSRQSCSAPSWRGDLAAVEARAAYGKFVQRSGVPLAPLAETASPSFVPCPHCAPGEPCLACRGGRGWLSVPEPEHWLLTRLRQLGCVPYFRAEDPSQLVVRAPKGTLTPDLARSIKNNASMLLHALGGGAATWLPCHGVARDLECHACFNDWLGDRPPVYVVEYDFGGKRGAW